MPEKAKGGDARDRPMKILIVDDSKAMRMIVRRTLRQAGFGDHAVTEVANGKEGLDSVREAKPDLILCDWNMPEMNGIEFLDALKAEGISVKFGFVTTERTPEMRERAESSGASFLIVKPFTPEDFKAALAPILG
jgi:two-component system chemotaxis response regulator CheY